MVTNTEEKQESGEEQEEQRIKEEENAASKADESEASKVGKDEKGGGEEKKEEELKYTEAAFNTEADKRAETKAQSMKDKAMKVHDDKLTALNKTIKEMQETAETAKSEAALKAQEKKELEEWGDTAEVKSFQESRRQHNTLKGEVDKAITLYEDNRTKLAEETKHTNALRVAISAILPEVSDFLESFVKELEEGSDSPKAMEYLAKLKSGDNKQSLIDLITGKGEKAKEKDKEKETTEIDSSSKSAPGGESFKDLSPRESVTRSLAKLRKSQGR